MNKYTEITTDIAKNMTELSKNIPDVMKSFSNLAKSGAEAGILDEKTKELIAMGIAVAGRCDGCIGFHTKKLISLGISEQEFSEMLGVAIFMGGGPSVMYAANALSAYKEFSQK